QRRVAGLIGPRQVKAVNRLDEAGAERQLPEVIDAGAGELRVGLDDVGQAVAIILGNRLVVKQVLGGDITIGIVRAICASAGAPVRTNAAAAVAIVFTGAVVQNSGLNLRHLRRRSVRDGVVGKVNRGEKGRHAPEVVAPLTR